MSKFFHLFVFILIFGCSDNEDTIPFTRTLDLPTEYSYEVSISCFCPLSYVGPHRLRIEEDQIIEYELLVDEEFIDSSLITTLTIDALAQRTQELLDQDPIRQDIELHPDYGFPVRVYIDVDALIVDEEWGFEISKFSVIRE